VHEYAYNTLVNRTASPPRVCEFAQGGMGGCARATFVSIYGDFTVIRHTQNDNGAQCEMYTRAHKTQPMVKKQVRTMQETDTQTTQFG
jgi:hypothetical protein